MNEPVDAVITWVNGDDPVHQEKRARLLKQFRSLDSESIAPTRFNQSNELTHCIHSLIRFAPWIRTIFIVTDEQIPPIFSLPISSEIKNKLKLIDHKVIFSGFEQWLPTFNSLAIETLLWRIPGLAEKFLYLNDDCFLTRPVKMTDFYQSGKLVLRGEWKTQRERKILNRLKAAFPWLGTDKTISLHRLVQEKSAKRAGYKNRFLHLPHAPFPLFKRTFANYFNEHPQCLEKNIRFPFRDRSQIWPISLALHLEMAQEKATLNNELQAVMVNGEAHSVKKIASRLNRVKTNTHIAFLCMQSIDSAPYKTKEFMLQWLHDYLNEGDDTPWNY